MPRNPYGPSEGVFDAALQPFQVSTPPPSGLENPVAGAVGLGLKFMEGMAQGRAKRVYDREMQQAKNAQVLQNQIGMIQNNPNLADVDKQEAIMPLMQGLQSIFAESTKQFTDPRKTTGIPGVDWAIRAFHHTIGPTPTGASKINVMKLIEDSGNQVSSMPTKQARHDEALSLYQDAASELQKSGLPMTAQNFYSTEAGNKMQSLDTRYGLGLSKAIESRFVKAPDPGTKPALASEYQRLQGIRHSLQPGDPRIAEVDAAMDNAARIGGFGGTWSIKEYQDPGTGQVKFAEHNSATGEWRDASTKQTIAKAAPYSASARSLVFDGKDNKGYLFDETTGKVSETPFTSLEAKQQELNRNQRERASNARNATQLNVAQNYRAANAVGSFNSKASNDVISLLNAAGRELQPEFMATDEAASAARAKARAILETLALTIGTHAMARRHQLGILHYPVDNTKDFFKTYGADQIISFAKRFSNVDPDLPKFAQRLILEGYSRLDEGARGSGGNVSEFGDRPPVPQLSAPQQQRPGVVNLPGGAISMSDLPSDFAATQPPPR